MSNKAKWPTEQRRALERAKRINTIVDLRIKGFSVREIAAKTALTGGAVHNMLTEALKEMQENTRESILELRDLEVERLDGMLSKLWPQRSNARTADTILRLMDRRSRLLGLDVAEQSEVTVKGLEGLTDEQITARLEAIVHAGTAQGDGGPAGGAEKKK